jgi:hypothetical protein
MRVYVVFSEENGLAGAFFDYGEACRFSDELAKRDGHKVIYCVQGLSILDSFESFKEEMAK